MSLSRTHVFSTNGPAPTGELAKPVPFSWIALGDPTKGKKLKSRGNTPLGTFSVILRVKASITSIDAIWFALAAAAAASLGSWMRRMLNFTAAASYGVPSENLILGRNFNVHTVLSADVNDSAVPPR